MEEKMLDSFKIDEKDIVLFWFHMEDEIYIDTVIWRLQC